MQVVDSEVWRAVLLVAAILGVMVVGDSIVYAWPKGVPQVLWALLDIPVHLILALLVVSPLFAHPDISHQRWTWLIITAMAAVLIDLDHLIAARSFRLEDALTLESRPFAHSLLFVLIVTFITLLLSRQPVGAAIVLGALLSHIVRDASHGSIPLWWPLPINVAVPVPVYYAIEVALGLTALWIAGRSAQSTWMDWVLALLTRGSQT